MLRDELYRIGREAAINAFRHSHAKQIEMELQYSSSQLRMLVRDNGSGIEPEVVRSGHSGHWGLTGMRERAERIGARMHVFSSAAGTEICSRLAPQCIIAGMNTSITVPGSVPVNP